MPLTHRLQRTLEYHTSPVDGFCLQGQRFVPRAECMLDHSAPSAHPLACLQYPRGRARSHLDLVPQRCATQFQPTGCQLLRLENRVVRIPNDRDAGERGKGLSQNLKRFSHNIGTHSSGSRKVGPGPRQTCDQAAPQRIGHRSKDDRDSSGRILGRERCLRYSRGNPVDLKPDQLLCKSGQPLEFTFREPAFNDDGLSLNIAELLQPLPERLIAGLRATDSR
jgi:hypothetical protein